MADYIWIAWLIGGIGLVFTVAAWFLARYVERVNLDKNLEALVKKRTKDLWTKEMCDKCREACMLERDKKEGDLQSAVEGLSKTAEDLKTGQDEVKRYIKGELRDSLNLGNLMFLEILEATPAVNKEKIAEYKKIFQRTNGA